MKLRLLLLLGMLVVGPLMAATPVHMKKHLEVPGAELYMTIRGSDAAEPLLIWLHGGPGGAERPLFRMYNAPLEQRFVVVYLDQRGTGRSFDRKADPAELTVSRHVADLDAVIDYLLGELGARPVMLVGIPGGARLGCCTFMNTREPSRRSSG